jgi:hypothetical protein
VSRLVRFYPRAWRDRYGAEFEALLEERPPRRRDVADTLLGAADAHLHPYLADPAAGPMPRTHRVPGLLAVAGGVLWCLVVGLATVGVWEAWPYLWFSLLTMFVSLPGDYMAAHGRRIAMAIGAFGLSFLAANLLPWGFAGIVVSGMAVSLLGGMLALVSIRAGIAARERWTLFALTLGLQTVVAIPISMGLIDWSGSSSPVAFALVVAPYGLAWALVGIRLAIRGSATFVDHPALPATEVPAK